METTVFALLATLIALAVMSEHWLWAGLLIGIAAMTRPDGILFLLLAAFYTLFGHSAMRQRFSALLRVSIPVVSLLGPFTLWRVHYYGHLISNAVKAKEGMPLFDQVVLGIIYVLGFVAANWPVVLLAAGVVEYSRRRKSASPWPQARAESAGPLEWFLLAYIVYVVLVGGDWMPAWRFLAPVVPLASALLVAELCARAPRLQAARRSAAGLAVAAFGLLFAASFADSNLLPAVTKMNAEVAGLSEIGQWFRRTLPPDTLVAAFDNGALSYYSQLPTIDMLGLTDEHIARSGLRGPAGLQGHLAYDYVYVAERRPAIVAFLGTSPPGQGFEAAPGPGSVADPLTPFYEPVSFWFRESRNPLGQYANILLLKSERTQIASWLAADPRVKRVPQQASFLPPSRGE